jgi:LysR family hca operon transcriptional activator
VSGKLDVAFLRPEANMPDLEFRLVTREPLVVVMPSDHRLASQTMIDSHDIVGETFINVSGTAPTLRVIIDAYLAREGIAIQTQHDVANLAMAMSLVASTRGVALLPAYAQNFLPWSVISRPLKGEAPTIDLVIGYHKGNTSPILKMFLSRVEDLIGQIPSEAHQMAQRGAVASSGLR